MNTGALISGILLLLIGILFEVLTRISRSRSWLRARAFIVIGIVVIVLSVLLP